MNNQNETGIEQMRRLVNRFGWCRESFNTKWSIEQLIQIDKMWSKSEWDIFPDQWTHTQLYMALKGITPDFRDNETPVAYDGS